MENAGFGNKCLGNPGFGNNGVWEKRFWEQWLWEQVFLRKRVWEMSTPLLDRSSVSVICLQARNARRYPTPIRIPNPTAESQIASDSMRHDDSFDSQDTLVMGETKAARDDCDDKLEGDGAKATTSPSSSAGDDGKRKESSVIDVPNYDDEERRKKLKTCGAAGDASQPASKQQKA